MADEPKKWAFLPNGYPATTVLTRGWQRPPARFDNPFVLSAPGGTVYAGDTDGTPDMEAWTAVNGAEFLSDDECNEFLVTHCRMLEVPEAFDADLFSEGDPPIEPWPDEIVAMCARAARLQDSAAFLDDMRRHFPPDIRDDVTINAALDTLVLGRLEAEWGALELKIAEFRKDRIEKYDPQVDPDADTECDNCDWQGRREQTNSVQNLHIRVEPGQPMPSGECPRCGGLCYPIDGTTEGEAPCMAG